MLLISALWWLDLVLRHVQVSWWEGLAPAHRWLKLGLVPLVGRAMTRGVFIGDCKLSVALGTLSDDGVPLSVSYHFAFSYCSGVLKARKLKWFAIPFSSGPHSVRSLHHDPHILDCPTGMA